MKFLAVHCAKQKFGFGIFAVENWKIIFMEHDLYLIS